MLTIIFFILGLIVGSFINVVTLRYNPEKAVFDFKNLGGRSHCSHCDAMLRWYDLLPLLSFLLLRGKCRYCKKPISWQYPLVELFSGFVFLLPIYFYNYYRIATLSFAGMPIAWYYIISGVFTFALLTFIILSVIDIRLFIIPDSLNIFLVILGIIKIGALYAYDKFDLIYGTFLSHYALLFELRDNIFINHIVAAAIGLVFFGMIVYVTRGRGMGMGDVKLAGALGVLYGFPDILLIIMLAFIFGSIISLYFMARRKKGMKDALPFGPFLVLSAVTVMFLGVDIIRAYFTIFKF